jgi:hypothetical protein
MLPRHFHRLLDFFPCWLTIFIGYLGPFLGCLGFCKGYLTFLIDCLGSFLGCLGFFNMPRLFHGLLEFFLRCLPYFRGPQDLSLRIHGFLNSLNRLTLRFLGFLITFMDIFLGISIGCLVSLVFSKWWKKTFFWVCSHRFQQKSYRFWKIARLYIKF